MTVMSTDPKPDSTENVIDRTIERDIQKLKNMELLEHIGSDRGSYWEIK